MSKKSKKKKERITTENIRRPKNFTLRSYNLFISQFIQRDNYGWYNHGEGQRFRFKAEQIRAYRNSKNPMDWNRPLLKETDKLFEPNQQDKRINDSSESHLYVDYFIYNTFSSNGDCDIEYERINESFESHLFKEDGFIYYTSSIKTDVAMFCLDIDSHVDNDLEASIAAADYIKTFFPGAYYDISTHGAGIHLYIFIDFTTFPHFSITDFEIRNRQFSRFLDNLRPIIKNKFNVDLDRPKGTYPHDYDLTNRGTLCKLPLPKNQEQFSHLVNSPIFTFNDLCNADETIKPLLLDIIPQTQSEDSLEEKEPQPEKVTPPSVGQKTPLIYTNNILGQETLFLSQKDRLKIKSSDATERTRATIRLLFRELGRRPSYEEWNQYYCNNGLNTGEETDKRKKRYEAAADYTEKTFNDVYTRAPYQFGEFIEELKNNISFEEMNRIAKTANFTGKMKYQDVDVVMGEHIICMYKNHKTGLELTVPTMGVKLLFENLSENKIYIRSCNNDRIRGARKVLVHIGWITQLNPNYDFGVSQKWGVGENCPRYGDFKTFVPNETVQKVIKQKNTKSLNLKGINYVT